jgi:hypothetical protein
MNTMTEPAGTTLQVQHIEKIWGTDMRLHNLIGPFVMNPVVIRMNGGYPFKNTEDHLWYVSLKNRNMITGFLAVCNGRICNDFTWQDNEVLEILLEKALSDMERGTPVSFMAEEYELPVLEKLGFTLERKAVRYAKMVKVI